MPMQSRQAYLQKMQEYTSMTVIITQLVGIAAFLAIILWQLGYFDKD